MSRVSQEPRLPIPGTTGYDANLYNQLTKLLREYSTQLNMLSEGRIQAVTNSATAAPTAGTYQKGDKVWNSNPSELGGGGSKYVIIGWICTVAGTPGTWLQMRTLTGN